MIGLVLDLGLLCNLLLACSDMFCFSMGYLFFACWVTVAALTCGLDVGGFWCLLRCLRGCVGLVIICYLLFVIAQFCLSVITLVID